MATLASSPLFNAARRARCVEVSGRRLSRHHPEVTARKAGQRRRAVLRGEDRNPEYRIAEDVRVATDAPVSMAAGLLSALLNGVIFIGILWNVGGDLDVGVRSRADRAKISGDRGRRLFRTADARHDCSSVTA